MEKKAHVTLLWIHGEFHGVYGTEHCAKKAAYRVDSYYDLSEHISWKIQTREVNHREAENLVEGDINQADWADLVAGQYIGTVYGN